MFCTKCGNQIEDGEQFCSNCGKPIENMVRRLEQPAETQTEEQRETEVQSEEQRETEVQSEEQQETEVQSEEQQETEVQAQGAQDALSEMPSEIPDADAGGQGGRKSGEPVMIAIVCVIALFILGSLAAAGYSMVKTKGFRKDIASYKTVATEVDSLGKYKKEYEDLLDSADSAAARFRFWKYKDLAAEMDTLADEIRGMNEAVEEYWEQYEEIVREIETDGCYVMADYEKKYQNIKSDLEDALSDFDEKQCKKKAGDFSDIRDDIITGNEKKALAYIEEARNIQTSFEGYDAHPFERYMIGDVTGKIENDKADRDYVQLNTDYTQLKEWADKFEAASRSAEQIGSFVQADVSESDKVKLYLNSYSYDTYNFLLENFIVYEENGGVWSECEAVNISQIKGALTMDLVADISGSMQDDFYTMQCAVEDFINSTHADTRLGLSTIGSIYERYQSFTLDKGSIINSAWGLECYGLTSLYQSLYSSVVYTASAEGARCVVAFTDGHNEPYGSGYDYDAQDVIDVSNYYQVPVYIIGIGNYVQSAELRNIAESTGGAYYDRVSIYDLQSIYMDIYEVQGRLYELSYKTVVPNTVNRDIYVLYADDTANLSVRLESELNAEALQQAYETSAFSADDLSSFYTDGKYLSSDDLAKLGDDLEAVQTVINIYYAMNGYQFGDGPNGQKQLEKMLSLGVISANGTLDGDTVTTLIKANPVLYQNFSALYNYRYELVYRTAYDIYWSDPSISYEDLRSQVHRHYGEDNETRFDPVTKAAWNALMAG